MNLSVEDINNSLVVQGITLQELAEKSNITKKEIINFMREEGFTYDSEEGFFIKSDDLQRMSVKPTTLVVFGYKRRAKFISARLLFRILVYVSIDNIQK